MRTCPLVLFMVLHYSAVIGWNIFSSSSACSCGGQPALSWWPPGKCPPRCPGTWRSTPDRRQRESAAASPVPVHNRRQTHISRLLVTTQTVHASVRLYTLLTSHTSHALVTIYMFLRTLVIHIRHISLPTLVTHTPDIYYTHTHTLCFGH